DGPGNDVPGTAISDPHLSVSGVPEAYLPGSGVPDPPSKAKLAWATLAALVVAGVVLVSAVLPAEYDIDPLGIGEALGLRVLANPVGGAIPVREDGIIAHGSSYRIDHRTFELEPEGFVEYKYRLEEGRSMVYSWTASHWVRSEMHSEADGAEEGTAQFFEVEERTLARHGSYVAPFPGIHGWYWLNETDDTVTVTLDASGFFSTSIEFRSEVAPVVREMMETPDSAAWRPFF
ncbi:MAG: hypothetical protein IH921_14385, partial [Gemmatimonadetes bacterium]|nr:hypothetical protein [Gemmatimonadota bacterium]